MSTNWVDDIAAMHRKYRVNEAVSKLNPEQLKSFMRFRLDFLQEELDEARSAFNSGDIRQAEDIADAMVDLCVVAIGTMDAFGINGTVAWDRVLEKNMQKEVGIKASRPNPLGLPDLIKPEGWTAPRHDDNIGTMWKLFV
jgi:predicted HAD superfamily Cof-like phosphohydrolase